MIDLGEGAKGFPQARRLCYRPLPTPPKYPRILLTGLPGCGKTTVVQRVAARFPGRAAGFYTREVREQGVRVGFEIVTLDGQAALLSHVDFPGPCRVGKYGVDLENLHRVGLPRLSAGPGIDLVVVDEVGKMECLSPRFVAAMERLWGRPVALLITVGQKGGGYMAALRGRPDKLLITVTPENREGLPDKIQQLITGNEPGGTAGGGGSTLQSGLSESIIIQNG